MSAQPLAEYRSRIAAYLRDLPIPYTSLAGTIITAHLQPETDLLAAALVLWACEACGGDVEAALPTAVAIELFRRSESLRDELLAGSPPWGVGQCLNAGDALHAVAYRALIAGAAPPVRRLRSSAVVTQAFVEEIERRNGALFWAGMEAGAILGGAPERLARRLRRVGRLLAAAAAGDRAYAAKAMARIEGSGLDEAHARRFAEIADSVVFEAA